MTGATVKTKKRMKVGRFERAKFDHAPARWRVRRKRRVRGYPDALWGLLELIRVVG